MNEKSLLLSEALGYIADEYLEEAHPEISEKASSPRRRLQILYRAALAACLCLVAFSLTVASLWCAGSPVASSCASTTERVDLAMIPCSTSRNLAKPLPRLHPKKSIRYLTAVLPFAHLQKN